MLAHAIVNGSLAPNDIREVDGWFFATCRTKACPADIQGSLVNAHCSLVFIPLGHYNCCLIAQRFGHGKARLGIHRDVYSNAFAVAKYGLLVGIQEIVNGAEIKVTRGNLLGLLAAQLNSDYETVLEATQGFFVVAPVSYTHLTLPTTPYV